MKLRSSGSVALIVVALLLLTPEPALAWGPATHAQLGLEVLRSLNLFPSSIAALLTSYPVDFLYGNLAADISMAKKYAAAGRHCHHWHVAEEIYEEAGDDPQLRAAMLGYLCHLAADVLAHNCFVPRQLLLTSSSKALGHSYWEHRMDADLGPAPTTLARWVVTEADHARTDDLFRRVLSDTLFSFGTNRRIFRGMIRISGHEGWQAIFDSLVDRSRWDLAPDEVEMYHRYAFEFVAGFLVEGSSSAAVRQDPIGEAALGEAKRIRRRVLMAGSWQDSDALRRTADYHFPKPSGEVKYWERRGETGDLSDRLLEEAHFAIGRPTSRLAPS